MFSSAREGLCRGLGIRRWRVGVEEWGGGVMDSLMWGKGFVVLSTMWKSGVRE